jgi:hypothetical protein
VPAATRSFNETSKTHCFAAKSKAHAGSTVREDVAMMGNTPLTLQPLPCSSVCVVTKSKDPHSKGDEQGSGSSFDN